MVTNCFNPIFVPVVLIKSLYCFSVVWSNRVKPGSSCFVVDTSAPGPGTWINLNLITKNPSVFNTVIAMASYLYSRVQE